MKFTAAVLSVFLVLVASQDPTVEPDTTGALDSSAANGVDPLTAPLPRPTIYGLITSSPEHTILASVIDALPNTSLTLDEPGARFTVFAPTDNAFRDLANLVTRGAAANTPDQIVAQILKGIEDLKRGPGFTDVRGILFYHLIIRHFTFAELEDFGSIATSQGKNVSFVDGKVRDLDPSRNDANASPKNIFTQNGWVHSLDSVLLPFDLRRAIKITRETPTPIPDVTQPPTGTEEPTTSGDPTDPDGPSGPVVVTDPDTVGPASTEEPDVSPSPDTEEEDDGVCFPSTARIHTPEGTVTMDQLEAGQEVLHHESGMSSKIFLFTHRTPAHEGRFYRITTSTGHAVTMTGNHYLYANERLTAADAVVAGDLLRTVGGVSPVVKVERVRGTGLYAPHSVHGDLVVDGIVVSGYSRAVTPRVAHAVLAPVRWFVEMTGVREPFGSILYDGGRGMEKLLPKGKARY